MCPKDEVNEILDKLMMLEWRQNIRLVDQCLDIAYLSLKAFGVDSEILESIFQGSLASLVIKMSDLLVNKRESLSSPNFTDAKDYSPIGVDEIDALISGSPPLEASWESCTFQWRKSYFLSHVVESEIPFFDQDSKPSWSQAMPDQLRGWLDKVRDVLAEKSSSSDLLVLLPLPKPMNENDPTTWHFLTLDKVHEDFEGAWRLLAGLTMLGLSHYRDGKRSDFFDGLIKDCEVLRDQIGVIGSRTRRKRVDPILKEYLNEHSRGPSGLVAMKSASGNDVRPFILNFSDFWRGHSSRFRSWMLRDRTGDTNEMTRTLSMFMPHVSGICLRISLLPNKVDGNDGEHVFRVLGPDSWIDHLNSWCGAKRNKVSSGHYTKLGRPSDSAFCIDDPVPPKFPKSWSVN